MEVGAARRGGGGASPGGAMKEGLLAHASDPMQRSPAGQTQTTTRPATARSIARLPVNLIGVPRESYRNERRVAATPDTVAALIKKGFSVLVEAGAGAEANIPDDMYRSAGARIGSREEVFGSADLLFKCRIMTPEEVGLLRPGGNVFSFVQPAQNEELVRLLAAKKATVFAMDCVPRITRAQVFDALSSMANIAGYKAVVEAAHNFGRFLGGQITAAGRIPPAKVLIIGGGVAGLSAIATAKNMGAIVRCFDTRPAVKEQVESLGGEFLEVTGLKLEEGTGGYAKEMTKEFIEAEMALFAAQAKEVDIIITTALIPGKPAPRLITKEMVASMKWGSVVVDLAAEMGGNIETTRKDELYVSENGVTHIGYTDLPSRLPSQSSRLYSNNVMKLFLSMVKPAEPGTLLVDLEDEVTRGCIVLLQGEKLWPPPRTAPPAPPPSELARVIKKKPEPVPMSPFRRALGSSTLLSLAVLALLGFNYLSSDRTFLAMIATFCLAGTAGYQAVWGVVPSLHTPLMSVTNAISGITAVGALLSVGRGSSAAQVLAYAALVASCVNIAGGFVVTKRMLAMFKRADDPREYNVFYYIPGLLVVGVFFLVKWLRGDGGSLSPMAYLACSLACIISIAALAAQKTARFGVSVGIVGVLAGVAVTLGIISVSWASLALIAGMMAAGFLIGTLIGGAVQVTDLPQTVAAFHSFVGLAAMLTSIAHFAEHPDAGPATAIAAILGDVIGAITLTGSIVAFLKLHGVVKSKPLQLFGKEVINVTAVLVQLLLILAFMQPSWYWIADTYRNKMLILVATALLSMFLGFHLVASIGGGDMPVCITVLNSYSGWALVAEGFMLGNSLLTIVGSLIGFSGGILSYIMCVAMNRSLANVLFGGYATAVAKKGDKVVREHRETTVEETVEQIVNAKKIIIVPGYGMAVAKAQYVVAEIARLCRQKSIQVKFAIHPVAGRMPGQMNVLLAEAGVPYDWVFEMEEINEEFADADIALVVGANDITNSAAEEDPTCAIAGMPVLQVWHARACIYMKRTMGAGYADLDNPVFYKPNTQLLLGDAKRTLEALVSKIHTYWEV